MRMHLVHDPGHRALHRAARVIIVAGGLFAIGLEVVGNSQVAIYGLFGGFAMLGFGDFGGAPWVRSRTYLTVTAVGAALIVVGTAVSQTWWLAALVVGGGAARRAVVARPRHHRSRPGGRPAAAVRPGGRGPAHRP
ncbi:MAG TPA: hypothetical protein VFF40_05295 [Acidimicrobiia bacterium]|nr:hypothetical protein [Acidimicrobiia bacterium]